MMTISSPPWRRAPGLLWSRPGVLATVAGACAVMAASVAAVPLFLSSAGTASVELQAAERCPTDTGATYRRGLTPSEVRAPEEDPFGPLTDALGPSNRWSRLAQVPLVGADPATPMPIWLVERDGALGHTEALTTTGGPGIWITDRAAEELDLASGDTAQVGTAQVSVAGVYRDLAGTSVDDYWCSLADALLLEVRGADLVLPPPMVLVDRETFADLMPALDVPRAESAWEAPLRGGLTVQDTEGLVARLACRAEAGPVLAWCEDGRPPVGYSRQRDFTTREIPAVDDADFVTRFLDSHLPFVTQRSAAIKTAVGGGVWPMAGFASLAGAGLVAAAASLWFDRRRREVRLLIVRGVSPAALGLKAVLELSLALLAGVLAGVGVAYALVVWLGPSSTLEGAAVRRAVAVAALALLGAALVVAAVVVQRARALHPGRPRRLRLGALPWELPLGWATVVSYQRLGDWGIPVGRGANVSRVDVWGLLFPVLFLVTAVAVLSRLLALGLRPLRTISRSWPTALYLGVRRVARYRLAVLGLVAASAMAAGVLGYAASMNRSLDATLQAKAKTFVGSDLAVRVPTEAEVPSELAGRATRITLHWDARVDAGGGRLKAAVIAIDPATFETAAFWDDTFADDTLREIVDRLDEPATGGAVPAVVVGRGAITGRAEVAVVSGGTKRFTVEAIPDVRTFPGMRRPKLTVFVAARSLDGLDLGPGRTELWVEGDRARSLVALRETGTGFSEERRAAEIADGASFVTVAWTFGFMLSLGLSAGLLVLGGVAAYLDARRRDRLLGYAFMQRMGLRRGPHRRALLVELTASVLVGCWVGLAIALVAAWLAHSRVDPVPSYRPEPLLRPATAIVLGLGLLALALSVVGAVMAQRRVDRDDPVEVLRAGV